jgi:uncharacterized protein
VTLDEPRSREAFLEWPMAGLGIAALRARGWQPTPIREFVVKLVGPCNLCCDYCYVYTGPDQSWRSRPTVIAPEVLDQAGLRIGTHARRHELRQVRVVLHGGEPLMGGPAVLRAAATAIRRHLPSDIDIALSVQTNGILLDEAMLGVCHDHGIRVGVSLDGNLDHQDRHRRFHDGRGSYTRTAEALQRLTSPAHRALFAGLLCTIALDNDPIAVYEALIAFDPPQVDFLLPHATWSQPPLRPAGTPVPYARWLTIVFDRWFSAPRRETGVRLFDEIIHLLLGGTSHSEQVGLSPAAYAVIDTDGSLQQVDVLKLAYSGAPETGLTVYDNEIDDMFGHPAIVARQLGLAGLSPACQQCQLVRVCGGGHYSHRYRPGSGFLNPSVYCSDLMALISHIAGRIAALGQP